MDLYNSWRIWCTPPCKTRQNTPRLTFFSLFNINRKKNTWHHSEVVQLQIQINDVSPINLRKLWKYANSQAENLCSIFPVEEIISSWTYWNRNVAVIKISVILLPKENKTCDEAPTCWLSSLAEVEARQEPRGAHVLGEEASFLSLGWPHPLQNTFPPSAGSAATTPHFKISQKSELPPLPNTGKTPRCEISQDRHYYCTWWRLWRIQNIM